MKIINKEECSVAIPNINKKIFAIYIVALTRLITILIHVSYQVSVALAISKKTRILAEYSKFFNIFFLDSAVKLIKHIRINNHYMNLIENEYPLYSLIYNLGLVELNILKTYIEAKLASSFTRPSKFFINALILFVQKKNSNFYLYINY